MERPSAVVDHGIRLQKAVFVERLGAAARTRARNQESPAVLGQAVNTVAGVASPLPAECELSPRPHAVFRYEDA